MRTISGRACVFTCVIVYTRHKTPSLVRLVRDVQRPTQSAEDIETSAMTAAFVRIHSHSRAFTGPTSRSTRVLTSGRLAELQFSDPSHECLV